MVIFVALPMLLLFLKVKFVTDLVHHVLRLLGKG
jgi:hypothetical protein